MYYPEPIENLIEELTRLPGIGPKTGQRLALHLLQRPEEEVRNLAEALVQAKSEIQYCSVCCNYTDVDPCRVCSDDQRDRSVIAVVEDPADVIAMERTREYQGLYHVLQGAVSPMEGIGPEDIKIKELLERLQQGSIEEVILATNPTVEGEATALYVARLAKPLGLRVTRIARGLPEGGDLDYVDEVTLTRALEGRQEL
jgi:recombination protein RecR